MKVLGKRLTDYLYFQRVFIALILVVGLAKLSLTSAGVSAGPLSWLNLTAITTLGFVYYSIRVSTSGFGTYRHLLPLLLIQNVLAQAIIIAGIALGIRSGRENVFTIEERGGRYASAAIGWSWEQTASHIVFGIIALSLVWWGIGSIVMLLLNRMGTQGRRTAVSR